MDYLNPLNLDILDRTHSTSRNADAAKHMSSLEHSELAMRAAKQMRRSKHKVKTGHKVCHHLLQMINQSVDQPAPRSAKRFHGFKHAVPQEGIALAQKQLPGIELSPANDRQFSLAF